MVGTSEQLELLWCYDSILFGFSLTQWYAFNSNPKPKLRFSRPFARAKGVNALNEPINSVSKRAIVFNILTSQQKNGGLVRAIWQ
jgi:hypothetical protein